MSEQLSQEEIDQMLAASAGDSPTDKPELSELEKDGLGEIGNISMGTASTTLSVLLDQKVTITTPQVEVAYWEDISDKVEPGAVLTKVRYKEGLKGNSILMLEEHDAKIICDLMMQGDGTNTEDPISELHLSAIGEAMNQMIGSSSTSISEMLNTKVDIEPPEIYSTALEEKTLEDLLDEDMKSYFVKTSFRITIGELVDSTIMQLIALPFAKEMFAMVLENSQTHSVVEPEVLAVQSEPVLKDRDQGMNMFMDIYLDVSVELGRTKRTIKDVLKMGPGSVLEMEDFSGEFVDILVNSKKIAKGEIVVVGENYGVRVTEILQSVVTM
jgi:flagellar motor switch protein FliN/FliY